MNINETRVSVEIFDKNDLTEVNISFSGSDISESMKTIRYTIPSEVAEPTVQDFVLFGIVHKISHLGGEWYLEGRYSRAAVINANAYIEAWCNLKPELYNSANIRFQEIVDDIHIASNNATLAFSGGVDSFFSLLRHKFTLGEAGHNITEALFVLGFDYNQSTAEKHAYEVLFERYSTYLGKHNIKLRSVSTNIKGVSGQNWSFGHSAQIASCMHLFHNSIGHGIIGSTAPYRETTIWGSNPATDYLLSGGALKIDHDGAGFGRTEKIGALVTQSSMVPLLKFCWQGDDPLINCGKCVKCLKTRVAFFAHTGETEFPCFEHVFDESVFTDTFRIGGDLHYNDFKTSVEVARRNGFNPDFIEKLESALIRHKPVKKFNILNREGII